jgi:colanic acid/amylovoran biosynthesis protein
VADHGRGLRRADWNGTPVNLVGLTHNRRFWRGDSLRTAHAMVRLGGGGSAPARTVAGSRAVLDISGGDSFTDLYGPKRFRAMILTKRMALNAGVPLILLPQKLGPFRDPAFRDRGRGRPSPRRRRLGARRRQLRLSAEALGRDFDPARHRLGVDVAVALPGRMPGVLDRELMGWLSPERDFPLAGLNVSGLLCNDAAGARKAFGLADRHTNQIEALARGLLEANPTLRLSCCRMCTGPTATPKAISTPRAALAGRLGALGEGRVHVLAQRLHAMELKWVLARLDWFAGARMHATIGAFSSGVPTLGLGYSDKAYGVFRRMRDR